MKNKYDQNSYHPQKINTIVPVFNHDFITSSQDYFLNTLSLNTFKSMPTHIKAVSNVGR